MSIKQQIFSKLDKDGYITDTELAKIYGKEPNFDTAETYKEEWRRLKNDRERFSETIKSPTVILRGIKRRYLIRDSKWDNTQWYKISKIYFDEIKVLFKKENDSSVYTK